MSPARPAQPSSGDKERQAQEGWPGAWSCLVWFESVAIEHPLGFCQKVSAGWGRSRRRASVNRETDGVKSVQRRDFGRSDPVASPLRAQRI